MAKSKTALQMLEKLVYSIKLSTEEAEEKCNPLAMVYHYDSMIVREARRVIERERKLAQTPDSATG